MSSLKSVRGTQDTAYRMPLIQQTKIRPPALRKGQLLDRPKLERKLLNILEERRVVVLHAPAGYGKSLLMAKTFGDLANRSVRVWVSLERGDDMRVFAESLILALEPYDVPWKVDPYVWLTQSSEANSRDANEILSFFTAALSATAPNEKKIIALDDLHRITDESLLLFVDGLITKVAADWQFIISTRSKTNLPLVKLSASGNLATFRESELSLDQEEIAILCQENENIDPSLVWEKTQGWPAAVQLALTASAGSTPQNYKNHIDKWVFSFIASEIVEELPQRLRDFLLRISIFPEVTYARANAVTENEDVAVLFKEIEERSLFAVDVGDVEPIIRFHELFRNALQQKLLQESSINAKDLLLKAAAHETDKLRAIEFLFQAKAWDLAANSIADISATQISDGHQAYLSRLLQAVPEEIRAGHAGFLFTEASIAVANWNWAIAVPYFKKAEELWRASESHSSALIAASHIPLAYAGLGDNELAIFNIERLQFENLDYQCQIRLLVAESWIRMYQGRLSDVVEAFARTVDLLRKHEAPHYLWQQAQPLPAFVGLPNIREPLTKWVNGAIRNVNDAPGFLRVMAQVLRCWMFIRSGDKQSAYEAFREAEGECSWLNSPSFLKFQLDLLKGQFFAIDEDKEQLEAHIKSMLADAFKVEQRRHRSAATGLILYLGSRFANQAGCYSYAAHLASTYLSEPESVSGWVNQNSYPTLKAIVAENRGEWIKAQSCWGEQIKMENSSELFGQSTEARLHCAAIYLRMFDTAAAEEVLRPAFDRVARENEFGILKLASPHARSWLAHAKWSLPFHNEYFLQISHIANSNPQVAPNSISPEKKRSVAVQVAHDLSSRELEVLERLSNGLSNKHIAKELNLSPFTVKRHVGNILNKLNLDSRGQASAWYYSNIT